MKGREKVLFQLDSKLEGELYYNDRMARHRAIRKAYATDASVYQELPLAVAVPHTLADLQELIRFARAEKITLVPRTAGTSLAGQVVSSGLIVDVSKHFNRVLDVEQEAVWVEPGVIRDDLNAYLKPLGLMFGPETSTSSRAMVGGMIGNNSSGLHSRVWGDTRSQLLEAEVLLSDGSAVLFRDLTEEEYKEKQALPGLEGEIYRQLDALLRAQHQAIVEAYPSTAVSRRNTGYALDSLLEKPFNLCRILAGSEGTLGLVTRAKLRLRPLPAPGIVLLCVHFRDLIEAMRANLHILSHAVEAVELVDKFILDFTKGHPRYAPYRFFLDGDPEALLIVEFRGEEARIRAEALSEELKTRKYGYSSTLVEGPEACHQVWEVRKAGLGLIRNLPGDEQPVNLIEDCAVSVEDLPAYVADVQGLLKEEGLKASYYAHAAAGELHIEPFINLKTENGRKTFRRVLEKTADIVVKYRGSLSGEHGDGRLRGEFIPKVLGPQVYALLEQVKGIFDPQNVFNAGKIVGTPPMDQFLRVDRPLLEIPTQFSYSEGLGKMAERCSGSGDCRKTEVTGGTMCPSFMATRNELDTTRARANLLRQFLSNKDKAGHEEMKEGLSLCLSCKACKSECPSKVDVAQMKAEFLQYHYDQHGVSWRAWLIAHFSQIQALASRVPRLYNGLLRVPFFRKTVQGILGFSPKRGLPALADRPLREWLKDQPKAGSGKTVYLFVDEFTNYTDTAIGKAAYGLLRGLGYEVRTAPFQESGRTFLSKGFLRKAKAIAEKNLGLLPLDGPVLGIEPSAVLTFRDEYLHLVGTELQEQAQYLAKNSFGIEEFLVQEWENGHLSSSAFTTEAKKIVLHGHCYQKAFHLVEKTEKALRMPANFTVEVIPSGCCGMAGSFGYEQYEVSMKVGELVLFPAVRKADGDTLIAAAGTSCRHQIKDGTGRVAKHPVEILFESIKP